MTAAFFGVLGLSHSVGFRGLSGESTVVADYVNGCTCALLVYVLLHDPAAAGDGPYARLAGGLAAFSFTLYVVHMPALVFLRAALVPGEPWRPDIVHVVAAGLLTAAMIAYAAGVAYLTEARTDRVRAAVTAWFKSVRRVPISVPAAELRVVPEPSSALSE
jgi:peptidoglycan/LPS O-acetylase OafA/YrhL